MSLVAVSGASGFVGVKLCSSLMTRGDIVHAMVRAPRSFVSHSSRVFPVGEIDAQTDFLPALKYADIVIHAAARTNSNLHESSNSLVEYRRVNVQGTLNLARQAVAVGVKRFVFVSSAKVNGESTNGFPFRATLAPSTAGPRDACDEGVEKTMTLGFTRSHRDPLTGRDALVPKDPYSLSKWEAEQGLWEISSETGMEVVIVRPPLIYGPGVKGGLGRLLNLVRAGVPLPLATVNNRRSLLGLDNFVDLLIRCMNHPRAAGQTFLASDGQDLSTPELLHMIANAMGRPLNLFPLPAPLLRMAGRILGRLNEIDRLVGSLQIDSSVTRELLDWSPPLSIEEGIRRMVMGAS